MIPYQVVHHVDEWLEVGGLPSLSITQEPQVAALVVQRLREAQGFDPEPEATMYAITVQAALEVQINASGRGTFTAAQRRAFTDGFRQLLISGGRTESNRRTVRDFVRAAVRVLAPVRTSVSVN
jgi:hypothetical protein